jgi:hypothetical protein
MAINLDHVTQQLTVTDTATNASLTVNPKGTGAFNVAAGSSGVNISNGGTVTAITRTAGGSGYATAPTVAISAPTTAGGVQATATCTVTAGSVDTTFTITNAGSGYVEQPTVSFSGGGGSGAAAYATVGANTSITGLGSNINFYTAGGYQQFQISNNAGATTGYFSVNGASQSGQLFSVGTGNAVIGTSSTGALRFTTSYSTEQARVAHTASAVNYLQVTGAATGGSPVLSAQGSDTNIDLSLTPKGTGNVRFGTYTGTILTPTGYVEIKDSGGTVRRLLVG